MSDYIESIFQSVDILINRKLEDLAYDTTVICTIIDSTDSKNGKYRVTDGSVSYIAYSDKDSFREGEQVRVNISQGDITQKKFIIGKYVADENASPITYVSPLESVVNISGNLMTPILGQREYGILANGIEKKKILWNQRLNPDQFRDLQANGIYNTLIVKADFKTLLYNHNYVTGTYGLRIELLVRPSSDSLVKMKRTVELTSKEMFGNPYNFAVFSPQAKTFSVVTAGIIEGIELSLFQNGDFTNEKGQYIKAPENMGDNILVKNIELGFGSNLLDVEDNVVRIYSENNLFYKYMPHTEDTNRKKIGLVWYNKDENNQYVGFSDGIYDKAYDEMAYIINSTYDTRLLAQKGREDIPPDELGLKLAANIEEAIPILYRISSMLTQDLCRELNYFKDLLQSGTGLWTTLDNLVDDLTLIAGDLREPVRGELIVKLENYYKQILKYVSDQINKVEEPSAKPSHSNFFATIFQKINNSSSSSQVDCLKWVINRLTAPAAAPGLGYQEVYDNCLIRVQRVINQIYDVINTLPTDMNNDYSHIVPYANNLDVDNYEPYAERDFSDMANKYCIYWYRYEEGYEDKSDKLKLMPNGWRRLTAAELKNPLDTAYTYTGLPEKNSELNEDGKEVYEAQPSGARSFVYPYMRNDQKEEKFVAVLCYNHSIYKSNELVFSNSQEIPDKHTLDKSDVLQFEHVEGQYSTDSYLVYNDIYYLRDTADEYRDREIRCHYDGLLSSDDALINARIYWYIPKNSTMISYDREFLLGKGFDTDDGAMLHYSKNGYVCFYKQIYGKRVGENLNFQINKDEQIIGYDNRSFWYRIKPYYEPTAVRNHILCKVIPGEDFDSVESGQYFTFGIAGTNGTKYTLAITNTSSQAALESSGNSLVLNVVLKDANNATVPFKDTPEVDWYMHTVSGMYMSGAVNDNKITISPHSGCGILKASTSVGIGTGDEGSKERLVKLECLYAVPWRGGAYYLSGPTYIVYNNFGTLDKSSMFDSSYKLFDANTHNEITGLTWSIRYYKGASYCSLAEMVNDDILDRHYMPVLNDANGLTPSSLYVEGIDYVPVVVASRGGSLYWQQPIIITQNRYVSSLLNSWDGSFQIDEENGTILSTMLGAGRKNTDNSFDGVLMGNIAAAAGFKEGFGLYGFNKGAQSFGLNVDGTAFFGKAGRGRIEIDGNSGSISSASYQQNKDKTNKAGMLIDLDDGFIDMLGTKVTTVGDDVTYEGEGKSHIRLDVKSPYFQISSVEGNKIIHIASDKYYLQSNNYLKADGTKANLGMHIDLKDGKIDAYNLKITSKNVILDSSGGSPYLEVKDNNTPQKSLLYMGNLSYYLQSSDYVSNTSGIKIDLKEGLIDAYKFKIKAGKEDTGMILLDSSPGSYYFYAGKTNNCINFSSSGFTLDTPQLSIDTSGNAKFSGYLTASSGTIGGWNLSTGFLDTHDGTQGKPGNVAGDYNNRFYIASLTAASTGNYLCAYRNVDGTDTWPFYVTREGVLHATGAVISGKITASSGVIGNCVINADGDLEVPVAHVKGALSADSVSAITIDASQITSGTINSDRINVSTIAVKAIDAIRDHGIGYTFIGDDPATHTYGTHVAVGLSNSYGLINIAADGSAGRVVIYAGGTVTMFCGQSGTKATFTLSKQSGQLTGTWYTNNSQAIISDINKKNSIEFLSEKYELFFNNLSPIRYKFNDGTSDRFHTGFIAQQVEQALSQSNLSSLEFAGLVISHENPLSIDYYLRYEEFIALNTWQIQKLKVKIQELETRLSNLEK